MPAFTKKFQGGGSKSKADGATNSGKLEVEGKPNR